MKGRKIFGGKAEGEALVSNEGISFYGGVDPDTGVVTEKGHPLEGQDVSGKVLVFPVGKGSTVGSYTIYRLKKNGKAPLAIINKECETVVAVGAIISEIPCVDQIDIEKIKTGDRLRINADEGIVECVKS
jgi:predicted aconitase with swiveling domain